MRIVELKERLYGTIIHGGDIVYFSGKAIRQRSVVLLSEHSQRRVPRWTTSCVIRYVRLDGGSRIGTARRIMTAVPFTSVDTLFTDPNGNDFMPFSYFQETYVRYPANRRVFCIGLEWYVWPAVQTVGYTSTAIWKERVRQREQVCCANYVHYLTERTKAHISLTTMHNEACWDVTSLGQPAVRVNSKLFFIAQTFDHDHGTAVVASLYVARVASQVPRLVKDFDPSLSDFDISHDGKWLAALLHVDGTSECHLHRLDSDGLIVTTQVFGVPPYVLQQCRFAPDGFTLLIEARYQDHTCLITLDVE